MPRFSQLSAEELLAAHSFQLRLVDVLRRLTGPAAIMEAAARELASEVGTSRCGYGEITADGEVVRIDVDWTDGVVPSLVGEARVLDAFGPAAVGELRAGRTLIVDDCLADPRTNVPPYIATWESIGTRALIVSPILKFGTLAAILYVHEPSPRTWRTKDVALVEDVALRTSDAVDRARAEAALRQSEEQMRALLTASSEVLYRMSPDWSEMRELAGGGFLADTTGPSQAWLANYIHPDDQQLVDRTIQQAIASKGIFDLEHRVMQADGSVGWTASRAMPIFNASGEIQEWFGAASDVTGRKRAEEALRASEERMRLIVENVRDYAIFVTDPAGLINDWLPGATHVFGWTAEEAIGNSADMTFTPEDRAAGVPNWELDTAQKDGASPNIRWHLRKDGARVFIEGSTTALRDHDDRLLGYLKIGQDVTARKQADEALRQSEERLRRVLDQLFAFVSVTTPDGTLVEVNRAPLEAAGITAANVIGKPLWDTYWWSYTAEIQQRIRDSVARAASGEVVRYDVAVRLADTRMVTIDFQIGPLRDDSGAITHLVPSAIVVEDRVRAQEELQRLNETLEHRVLDAVEELTKAEEALRQSRKLESMGQLTGGVAHDFNNLLTPIIGSLDMLERRGVGDERTQRLIGNALKAAERAKTLVQRLLAFARRQPLQPVPVELATLVQGMAELVSSTSGPRVEVELNVAGDLPVVKADPNQLEMAILNLAVNARDAMPDGGKLTIAADPVSVERQHRSGLRPGKYVRLCVADTGSGMDEVTLRRAVEPFFSTKGIGRGTGLGLSMVHGLAGQLGGALTIRSKLNVGTSIELWLPVLSDGDSREISAKPLVEPLITGVALLVDDEEAVRASTAHMLMELGFVVVEAGSAEDALAVIDSRPLPDVLITDHLMPGMTGTQLAGRLKSRGIAVPVLIISGYAEDSGIEADLPRLTKPFRQSELVESLLRLNIGLTVEAPSYPAETVDHYPTRTTDKPVAAIRSTSR